MRESLSVWRERAGAWASSRLARGTLLLQFGGAAQRAAAMIAHFLLARLLGPNVYGAYVLIVSAAMVLPFVTDFGVRRTVLTRYAATSVDDEDETGVRVLVFALRAALLSASTTLVLGRFLLPAATERFYGDVDLGLLAWLLCWGGFAAIPYVLVVCALEARRKMRAVLVLEVLGETYRLAAVAAVLFSFGSDGAAEGDSASALRLLVFALVLAEVAKGLTAAMVVAVQARRGDSVLPPFAVWAPAFLRGPWSPEHWRFGLAASVSKRVAQGVQVLFPLLVGAYAAPRDAGFFRIGWTLGTLPLWLLTALARNLLPALAERRARDDLQGLRRTLAAATCVAGAGAMVLCGALAFAAPWLIERIYGPGYTPVLPIFYLFLVYTILVGFGLGHEQMYLVRSDLKVLTWRSVIVGVSFVFIAPWTIRAYGAFGAAAMILGGTFAAFLFDFYRTWMRDDPSLNSSGDGGDDLEAQRDASAAGAEQ